MVCLLDIGASAKLAIQEEWWRQAETLANRALWDAGEGSLVPPRPNHPNPIVPMPFAGSASQARAAAAHPGWSAHVRSQLDTQNPKRYHIKALQGIARWARAAAARTAWRSCACAQQSSRACCPTHTKRSAAMPLMPRALALQARCSHPRVLLLKRPLAGSQYFHACLRSPCRLAYCAILQSSYRGTLFCLFWMYIDQIPETLVGDAD